MINRINTIMLLRLGHFALICCSTVATHAVTHDTVPIGNIGNLADSTGFGAVDIPFRISRYEVTNAQYAEFLNAVADTDTHVLYNTSMPSTGITRSGNSGSFTYAVNSGREEHPVVLVGFWDAVRYTNWLHNGQPSGAQGLSTTEDGAYFLNGVTSPVNDTISRDPNARWFIPSEDEWYKAAYHKNDGDTGNYWEYPTKSDFSPSAEAAPGTDLTNGSANYDSVVGDTTPVGAYTAKPSRSAYGTFDQGGNVSEWNETIGSATSRVLRGGSYNLISDNLAASRRQFTFPTVVSSVLGFRVARIIPEPSALQLGAIAGVGLLLHRRLTR